MTLPPRWLEPPVITGLRTFGTPGFRIVEEILARRGFESKEAAEEWLNPDLDRLADSIALPGLEPVVSRIQQAIQSGERIVIFGDYDADGITSTAILYSALCFSSSNPAGVSWMLPTRSEGYGLRDVQVPEVAAEGPGLLITVDCGSNDGESIAAVRAVGMDVVVIDHHQISSTLPEDVPHLNPQLGDDEDAKRLTGAGLSWLVVRRLAQRGVAVGRNGEGAARYLELSILGTGGDVAGLIGFNRAMVRRGMEQLQASKRPGLKALSREGGFRLETLKAEDLPFQVTSRLNSPGRFGNPSVALDLLLARTFDEAHEAAREVVRIDQWRKDAVQRVTTEAISLAAAKRSGDAVIVVDGANWEPGVLGPVAAKLVEEFRRPAVVVSGDGALLTGSGRSVPDWDIAAAFRVVTDYLVHHGGHAAAAGLTVDRLNLDQFRAAINEYASTTIPVPEMANEIQIDADIDNDPLILELGRAIEQMAPFGKGNPRPVLRWRGVQVSDLRAVGKNKATLQFQLLRGQSSLRAVMFRGGPRLTILGSGQPVDVLIELSVGFWNGFERLEARVIDAQLSV